VKAAKSSPTLANGVRSSDLIFDCSGVALLESGDANPAAL
jgi:hypothetical protein